MDGGDQSYDEVERLIDPHDVESRQPRPMS